MIAWLRGRLRALDAEGRAVIDVGGVGYVVTVPVGVLGQAAVGDVVELHVHTQVREDVLALFGFDDEAQHKAFLALIQVSKVGPKLAVNILSGVSPAALAAAVEQEDLATLTRVSGVGRRLAERLVVELRGKLDLLGVSGAPAAAVGGAAGKGESATFRDLRSALTNLQYRPKEIDATLAELEATAADEPFEALLRRALSSLRK